jgi:arsenate reductase-like glutaredoxin family protein
MKENGMSVLATDDRQLTLIYNSRASLGKQTVGYAESAGDKIFTIDVSKTKIGDTIWVSIAEGLKKPLHELLAKDLPELPEVNSSDFETNDWLKLLNKNPDMLQQPIAINGNKYMQITTPSEVLKFFKVDSAGLEKNKLGEEPATKPETDKDTFV